MVKQRWPGWLHLPGHFYPSIGLQEKKGNIFIFRTPFSIEMAMLEKIVKNSVLVVFISHFGEL